MLSNSVFARGDFAAGIVDPESRKIFPLYLRLIDMDGRKTLAMWPVYYLAKSNIHQLIQIGSSASQVIEDSSKVDLAKSVGYVCYEEMPDVPQWDNENLVALLESLVGFSDSDWRIVQSDETKGTYFASMTFSKVDYVSIKDGTGRWIVGQIEHVELPFENLHREAAVKYRVMRWVLLKPGPQDKVDGRKAGYRGYTFTNFIIPED